MRVPDWEHGMGHVLATGVRAVQPHVEAVVVLLGDQPNVEPAAVRALVGARQKTGAATVTAAYAGVTAHPRLFGRELFAELGALDGDRGARDILLRYPPLVVPCPGGPMDVDDEASLSAVRMLDHYRG
jgi:molybdenum cofactor cytidylyltransferase